MPSRHKMMNTRYKVHVWPNSHPKGGGGHIHSSSMENHANSKHPSMLAQTKNTEDIRQDESHDDHQRASLCVGIKHPRYLSSQDSTVQVQLYERATKLYEKTSPQDMSRSMDNHSFSPTVTKATLKSYKPVKMVKGSHMEFPTKVYMKKTTYDVPGSISHIRSLTRHKPVIKSGNSHKTSTPQDQLKVVEYKGSNMEHLTITYDVPSSVRHPKNAHSVSLNLVLSPNMAKKALKVPQYEQNVLKTNVLIYNSGYLNKAHQDQKKLQHEQKALQYKVKTSSDADATQDPDHARVEGLHPREGITRHSALPVGTESHRVLASSTNPIAAGQVLRVYH
jgi:hypothetical protein